MKISRLERAGILPKWHHKTLEGFDNDPSAKEKVENYLKNHKEAYSKGVGLYLYGANGVGKSMLLNTAFKELLTLGYSARIVTLGTLVTMYSSAWYDTEDYNAFQRMIQKTQFLGIEEIGKEYRSAAGANLSLTALDSVLRLRCQLELPTWFASNVTPKQVGTLYSIDVQSMLKEMAVTVAVKGRDRRDDIKEQIKTLIT